MGKVDTAPARAASETQQQQFSRKPRTFRRTFGLLDLSGGPCRLDNEKVERLRKSGWEIPYRAGKHYLSPRDVECFTGFLVKEADDLKARAVQLRERIGDAHALPGWASDFEWLEKRIIDREQRISEHEETGEDDWI